MTITIESLVSTEWLASQLGAPDLVVLDASRHLPASGRDPRAEYESEHIPGARFLDLATLVDQNSLVPQALPRPEQLAQRLVELGVQPGNRIAFYDDSDLKSSARAWFMLTAHGVSNVAILDGGLGKWRAEGRMRESGGEVDIGKPAVPASLAPATSVRSKTQMLANIQSRTEQVLDARSADRVFGDGNDPVHGGANGRIPGSLNLPIGQLFNADGTYKPPAQLRAAFEAAGVDFNRPVTTTCGSGITASVLMFAFHLIGKRDTALYDGSWMEWCADPETPKLQGPE